MGVGGKRAWKKYAEIEKREANSGDVKFVTGPTPWAAKAGYADVIPRAEFESLLEAEQSLDAWYAEWWPKQTKKASRA